MHGETQANRLAALMQKKAHFPSYELALPLVTVKSSTLARRKVKDIILLGLEQLECVLVKDGRVCANLSLTIKNGRYYLKIEKNDSEMILTTDSHKYETLLCVLGTLKSRTLEVGHLIELSELDLEKVTVIQKDKKIAEGTLINVEGKLAVQLDKVEKYE